MPAGIGTVTGEAWVKVDAKTAGGMKKINAMDKAFAGMGLSAAGALKTIMKFAGAYIGFAALTKGVTASTRAFVDFNEALRETHTLQDKTWEQMQDIGEEVRSLARDFPDMATVAQQAMYEINSAVFFGSEALSILETSLRGASAGITDVQTTADVLTTVLNAFNMSGYEAEHVMDLFFTTIKIGKTRLPALTSQFGRLAGIAGPVGSSISDLTAAISFLTRRGLETRWAITALRQTFMQIIKPTKHLKDALSALGYVSGSTMIREKGFAESLRLIVEWAGNAGIKVDQLFTNIRAVMAVLPLASSLTGEKGYAWDLEQMANSAGAAQVAFAKMEKSWAFQLNRLKSLFNDLGITIGETFVPALSAIVTVGTAAANVLRPLVKLFGALGGGYFIAIASGIGVLTGAIWLLTKAYSALSISMASALTMGTLSQANIGAKLGAMLYGLGGGSMLAGLGATLGAGLLGAFSLKTLVNVDLKLGKVEGEKKVWSGIWQSILAAAGIAAAVGMVATWPVGIIAGGLVLTIKVLHELAKPPEGAAEAAQIGFEKFMERFTFPTITTPEELGEQAEKFLKDIGANFFTTMPLIADELNKFYDILDDGAMILKDNYNEGLAFFNIIKGLIPSFSATGEELESLGNLVTDTFLSVIDVGDTFVRGFLTEDQISRVSQFLRSNIESIQKSLRGEATTHGITARAIQKSAEYFLKAQEILNEAIATGKDIPDLAPRIEGVAKGFAQMIKELPLPAQMQATIDFLDAIGAIDIETGKIKTGYEAVIAALGYSQEKIAEYWQFIIEATKEGYDKATEKTLVTIVTMADKLETAKTKFAEITAALQDESISADNAITLWGELSTMEKEWTTFAEIATATGRKSAKMFQDHADAVKSYIAGGEGLNAIQQAVQDLYIEYGNLKKAYEAATEGSIEQAIAQEGLAGVYSKLIGYQGSLGLETKNLNLKWQEMLEWLGSIGLAISKITISDFTDQIAAYEKALAEAVKSGNTAAIISNLSGLEGIYVILNNEIEKLRDTEYAYLIDVLKPLIATLEKAYGFKPPAPAAKTSWFTPLSQAADMIVAGAGQLVNSIKSAHEAFEAEDWAGVASGTIGIIQSIANIWLREEKERLEERKRQLEEEKRLQEEMLGFWKESLTGLISSFGSILSTGLGDILGPLAGVVDTLSNAFSKAIEMTFLDGIDLLRAGMELFNSLITGLVAGFMNLLKQANAYSALQEEMSGLWKAIADLLGMFIWPLVAAIKALKGFLGIVDETSEKLASLNVPAGFKAARLEYAAAEAGVPAAIGGVGYTIPKWAVAVGETLAGAIMDVLEGFGISDWTSLLQSFKEGSIQFWNYVITRVPEIINSIASILSVFENAFGGISVSTIVDWLKAGVSWLINDAPAFFAEAVEFFTKLKDFAVDVMEWAGKVDWDKLMTNIDTAFADFNKLLDDFPTWDNIKAEIVKIITAIDDVEKAIRGVESTGHTITNIAGGAAAGAAVGTWLLPGIGTLGGAIAGGAIGWLASLLGFAEGGIVPGPIGAPQLAVVHGGEEIHAIGHPAQGLSGMTLTLNNIMQVDGREVARAVRKVELKDAITEGRI